MNSANKKIHIIGGGTVFHLAPHFALCSPAYGTTAKKLHDVCSVKFPTLDSELHLTKMAGGDKLETNADIEKLIEELTADPATKIIFLTAAMCDYERNLNKQDALPTDATDDCPNKLAVYRFVSTSKTDPKIAIALENIAILEHISSCTHCQKIWEAAKIDSESLITSKEVFQGKYGKRLKTRQNTNVHLDLVPSQKVVGNIRKNRKDIFAIAFKTTSGATPDEQYIAGLHLLKESSVNLVFANDVKTRLNMVITPEEARYHETTNREEALMGLIEMTYLRSHLTFTRSTVVAGKPVPWDSELVPEALRTVVDYCIQKGAYKPFRGATVGHFACKLNDNTFLTSIRKTNFNDLPSTGLVRIETDGPDSVLAYGAKPSVGGQSQRIVFNEHKEYDCIVHFHSPIKKGSEVPQVSQREYECGSHQCGNQTSKGLKKFGNLSAVYLQEHGPNIVFNRSIDPQEVIDFIDANFNLNEKTGGYVNLGQILEPTKQYE